MPILLFIKWDEQSEIGYSIIDEQHRGLVATINSLFYFLQQGWALVDLKPTILLLEQYIMFHLKTEESILLERGIPNKDLKVIQEYSKAFLSELHNVVTDAINHDEANGLTKYLAKWWLGHKTEFHDKLEQYFTK